MVANLPKSYVDKLERGEKAICTNHNQCIEGCDILTGKCVCRHGSYLNNDGFTCDGKYFLSP